jgi:conjugal transfer pilus assembly protein TraV
LKSKHTTLLCGISLLLILCGCNPYSSEFKCGKDVPFGQCASTPEIYQQEVPGKNQSTPPVQTPAESAYREAELNKFAKLLNEPVTPIVVPPPIMRILVVPHQGEYGELNMPQYIFIMVGKSKWVMGDYLVGQPNGETAE